MCSVPAAPSRLSPTAACSTSTAHCGAFAALACIPDIPSPRWSRIPVSTSTGPQMYRSRRHRRPIRCTCCEPWSRQCWPTSIRSLPGEYSVTPRRIKRCAARRVMIFMRPQQRGTRPVKAVEAAVIGVGWVGGTRAETLARTALVDKLHLCDIKPDRLAEVKALYRPATATLDYQDIIKNERISVVYISTTPEANHYPIARDCLKAGKNVMLEKPIALELWEADELIQLAKRNNLKFTIGYSQRFNPKIAFAKKKIVDGTLGNVVSVLVSRHLSRELGKKIASRVRLSPVVMESTHDLDFVFWLLEPAKPVRVYSQGAYGYMEPINGSHDIMFTTVTMDNGVVVMIGGGWNFPPSFPNYCSTWIEITGTDGALTLDDTQRDNWLNTEKRGQEFPMSTMPGEWVDHVFAGGIGPETIHFLEACIRDTAVMVTPESARRVMETYSAADLSADRNQPIDLPLTNETISGIAELKAKNRAGLNV